MRQIPCANPGCGTLFNPPNHRQKTCSPECGFAWRSIKWAARKTGQPVATPAAAAPAPEQSFVPQSFNWRRANRAIGTMQDLRRSVSVSTERATIPLGDGKRPILLATLSDVHFGAWSSDHDLFERITDEILSIHDLYVALVGDLAHMAIKLRGVLEVTDNILPPELQLRYLESWLDEIQHKVAFATWDNHAVMREEAASGISAIKLALGDRFVYCNGIGHLDLTVGQETYKVAASHFFRGRSMLNPVHAQMRYMRMEGLDREICLAGDSHVPGMMKYTDGPMERIAINTGSTQTNSGYAKRLFSLKTHPIFPCVELWHDRHLAIPYWSIQEWLAGKERHQ